MPHKSNQKGFAVVETVLILVIVALVAGTGYYAWHANQQANKTYNAASKSANNSPSHSAKKQTASAQSQKYLAIKEWQASVALTSPIGNATYHLKGNTAWLSTTTLDKDSSCYNPNDVRPTFAGITRYQASDQVDVLDTPKDGDNYMTAAQAVKVEPKDYKQIGNYVFFYDQGNGQTCSSESTEQVNAFAEAFGTIDAE